MLQALSEEHFIIESGFLLFIRVRASLGNKNNTAQRQVHR